MIQSLPPSLRSEVIMITNKILVKKIAFFMDKNINFVQKVI